MTDPYFIFYQTAMIASLLASMSVIILTWRQRQAPGTNSMIALSTSTFIWTLGFLLETNSDTLETQLLFNNVGYIGSMFVPVAWFIFSLHYSRGNRIITGKKIIPFCIFPLATIVLIWTNDWHHFMWSDEHLIISEPFIVTAKTYRTFFWVALAHNYILIISGIIILLYRLLTGTPLYKGQAISLMVAVSVPLIWNAIYVFNLLPLPRKDLTPVAFAISGIAIAFGLMRYQLFTAVPFARKFLIQQLGEGVLAIDMHNIVLEVNNTALSIFGLDNAIVGKNVYDFPQFSPVLEKLHQIDPEYIELLLNVSSEVRVYELKNTPIIDKRNQQVGWLIILRDITERKRRELEYKTVIQTTVDGFWTADMEGRFLDVNDAYCQMVGYSRLELLDMGISDIEAIEKPDEIRNRTTKVKEIGYDRFETKHRCKDGRVIDIEVSANYIDAGSGKMFVFLRDVTQRNKMQEQLLAQDRLASIGELTAGIAHELNNPLSIIKGYSELILQSSAGPEIRSDLSIIGGEVDRAAKIVDNLLTFAREHPDEKHSLDVNEIIEKTLELRRYQQAQNNIVLVTHLSPHLQRVMGNEFQLQQVFINIIINAEHFMIESRGKGTLTISTEISSNSVYVYFEDDGPGITQENIKRLFDPFFTTKEIGKGTGLGLSICHGIVTEHGGRIWAESTPGKGATFIIELPSYQKV